MGDWRASFREVSWENEPVGWGRLVSTLAAYFRGVFLNPKGKGNFDFPSSRLSAICLASMQREEHIHEKGKTPRDEADGEGEVRQRTSSP